MVIRPRMNFSGVPSDIRAEHLLKWISKATRDVDMDDTHWMKVVALVHAEFGDGPIAEEGMWHTVVLIQKGEGRNFRVIGLMEVLWNTTTGIINRRLTFLNRML